MPKDPAFETRLDHLREEARSNGIVQGRGVDVAGGPMPRRTKPGYFGENVVRPPVWTWEIPVYFFAGGMAGMSSIIACAAWLTGDPQLARAAMWIGAIAGGILSPVLLIMDLGRSKLFLNMLRVFKIQSPMSMGAWILTAYGTCSVPAIIAFELSRIGFFEGALGTILRVIAAFLAAGAGFWGMFLATYTGVLIAATVIPAWFLHRVMLPIHFGIAGLGSAAGLLELLGFQNRALWMIGAFAAGVETVLLVTLELRRHGDADRQVHEGRSGWMIRGSEVLTGPLALILRLFGLRYLAAVSFLLGALLSRFGWIEAGRRSGCDPVGVFDSQHRGLAKASFHGRIRSGA